MTPSDLHQTLLGEDPAELHASLYDSGKMGFSDKTFDEERFSAIVVLTLQKTMRKTIYQPERVVLLVAPTHEKWVLGQLNKVADRCFGTLKKVNGTPQGRIQFTKLIGGCFNRIFVGSRLLQLPEVPEAWTSFGFSKTDPIPDWMREGLLE